jgi:hypothetical protein
MPDVSSLPTAWVGAPPVWKDGFAFVNGDFLAETPGRHRHRRATLTELKEHFQSGSDKDHPAHWFEAQLLHYGLQPSQNKAVARMRLFDAVNSGQLARPAHLIALETELKKEWTKQDREAKRNVSASLASSSAARITGSDSGTSASTRSINNEPSLLLHASPIVIMSPGSTLEARYGRNYRQSSSNNSAATDQNVGSLGLINGRYYVHNLSNRSRWHFHPPKFELVLTLAGTTIWGSFDFGVVSGIMYFNQRPYSASDEHIPFTWRGQEDQGSMVYGDDNHGWIAFLGDGRFDGYIDFNNISFRGRRAAGQGTTSPVDARTMRAEWDMYSYGEHQW